MDVRHELLELLAEQGFESHIADDTNLRDELEIDSTALVEIAVAIERRLRVSVDGGRFIAVQTFGDMAQFVEELAAPGGASVTAGGD